MWNKNEKIPSFGYELTLWGGELSYRATAVAYMERENLKQVTHKNGKSYFLNELKEAIINTNKKLENKKLEDEKT